MYNNKIFVKLIYLHTRVCEINIKLENVFFKKLNINYFKQKIKIS